MHNGEIEFLAELASKHTNILELGSYLGRSTAALADNCQGFVIACDHFRGPDDVILAWKQREAVYSDFVANMGDRIACKKVVPWKIDHAEITKLKVQEFVSHNFGNITLPMELRPTRIDMVYIDGSHRPENVTRDIQFAASILEEGGLICGHDYDISAPGVVLACNNTLQGFKVGDGTRIWYKEL
jgi:predicted O-methyltransferase YrrM